MSIHINRRGGVGHILIDRPNKRNALTDEMFESLIGGIVQLQEDIKVKLIQIEGADGNFCAGRDISSFKRIQELKTSYLIEGEYKLPIALNRALLDSNVPTLSVIRGFAFGAGAGLASWCDVALATTSSQFSYSEIKLGLAPSMVTIELLREGMRKQAVKLLLTGERFDSKKAKDIGLITDYFEEGQLDAEVERFATDVCAKSSTAVRLTRDILRNTRDMDYEAALAYAKKVSAVCTASVEAQEGINAFLEKRQPQWD